MASSLRSPPRVSRDWIGLEGKGSESIASSPPQHSGFPAKRAKPLCALCVAPGTHAAPVHGVAWLRLPGSELNQNSWFLVHTFTCTIPTPPQLYYSTSIMREASKYSTMVDLLPLSRDKLENCTATQSYKSFKKKKR